MTGNDVFQYHHLGFPCPGGVPGRYVCLPVGDGAVEPGSDPVHHVGAGIAGSGGEDGGWIGHEADRQGPEAPLPHDRRIPQSCASEVEGRLDR